MLALLFVGTAYEAVLLFTSLLGPYRFPIPYAVPIFDGAFAVIGLGVGYLGLERRKVRHDAASPPPDGLGRLFLAAGLIWGFALLGVLTSPDRYGVAWYVAGVARPIGVGLIFIGLLREQVWLYRDARRRVHSLEKLRSFAQALLQATSEREIVAAAAHTTRELMGADASGVYLADDADGRLRLEAGLGWDAGTVGHVPGIRWGIVVPLGLPDQPLGVVAAFHRTPRPASDDEQRVLASVADQTALALEKARLYAELQESVVQLSEAQGQLIQADKLKALGTLLSGMAHELNNPLSTIQLSVQLMKRADLPEAMQQRLGAVEEECERATRIIRDLLVFARRKAPERKTTDLNRVLNGVIKLQAPELDLHRIRVVTELAPLPPVVADPHQLQQVLLNLCTNAMHAMNGGEGGGMLSIRSARREREVVVEIEDTGPGIPAEHLGRIFDPFFTTKSASEGTGLGLSLSIGIVQAHGGRIEAMNLPERGARFTVVLPAGTDAPASGYSEKVVLPANGRRRGRVLVVDDERLLRNTVAEVLTTLGHSVKQAGSGREALDLVAREPFDVVTLDLRLPDVDGKTVWRTMLARDPRLAARVIFLTGDTMSADTQKFLDEAQRPVLTKPLTINRISRVIDDLLEDG